MTTRVTATAPEIAERRIHRAATPVAVPVRNQAALGAIQRKLRVGPAGDRFEREADSVADAVMRMPQPTVQRCPGGCPGEEEVRRQPMEEEEEMLQPKAVDETVQRQEEEEEELMPKARVGGSRLDPAAVDRISVARGGGSPLPGGARDFFEPRFDHDFGSVRVHADDRAAGLSRQVNARAFTVGSGIFFGAGEYRPDTSEGRRLVAHELTHVVQQGG